MPNVVRVNAFCCYTYKYKYVFFFKKYTYFSASVNAFCLLYI